MVDRDRTGMAVALTCKDMRKSVAFYRDVLGFRMKESWPDEEAPMWANMLLGDQSVMLGGAVEPAAVEAMCGGDVDDVRIHTKLAEDFQAHRSGVGVSFYLYVPDIDAYASEIAGRGAELLRETKTQFYGIREALVDDPDGYRLVFYTPVAMESCQSCGMPLTEAKPGDMYCDYCTDDTGALRPYEQVFEGTVAGYFMAMQKLERAEAEVAAKEHLAKMPAWVGR